MDPYSANIVAATRRDDYVRDAENERLVRRTRRDRKRHQQAQTEPTPRHHEVTRPAIA